MGFEITELQRDPADRVYIHAYDVASGSLAAGDRIQVRMQEVGQDIVTLFDVTVPEGKAWTGIEFQFQAVEDTA